MREIHGMTDTSTYITWREIKQRCANKRNKAYPYYGGRGITYCKEWESFVTFLRDMGERPSGTSLDRINNDGPYSPENCKWSTRAEQARNRRGIKLLTFKGKTMCIAAWAEECGLADHTLAQRLRNGWHLERALTEPSQRG